MADRIDVDALVDRDIPEARRVLVESQTNLTNLADYVERNYLESPDKREALEQTKQFAIQSLASVAHQINVFATGLLNIMKAETTLFGQMESDINHLALVSVFVCVFFFFSFTSLCRTFSVLTRRSLGSESAVSPRRSESIRRQRGCSGPRKSRDR